MMPDALMARGVSFKTDVHVSLKGVTQKIVLLRHTRTTCSFPQDWIEANIDERHVILEEERTRQGVVPVALPRWRVDIQLAWAVSDAHLVCRTIYGKTFSFETVWTEVIPRRKSRPLISTILCAGH